MSFAGATINKLNGGLGRTSGESDRIIALVMGMTLSGSLAYNKPVELLDITEAETAGITETADDTNGELVHYHLSEMFRLCPGFTYYLIPVDKTKTIAQLVADKDFLSAIRGIEGINVVGIAGLTDKITAALTNAPLLQGLVDSFALENILIDGVFVEGVGADAAQTITSYGDLRTLTAPNVCFVIGQDPLIASLKIAYAKHAAIGTALGSVAVRAVHEDVGSVDIETKPGARKGDENYSLSDETTGRWASAALSDGTTFKSLTPAEQKSLTDKGYMYVGCFNGYSGFFWNGCPSAVSKTSDYAYFNYNCIWNKAARIIRQTLIPKIRSKAQKDPTTGYLKTTWVAYLAGLINSKLETMVTAGNCEDFDVYINPNQTPTEDKPLNIKVQIVADDIVHEFEVDLGYTTKTS